MDMNGCEVCFTRKCYFILHSQLRASVMIQTSGNKKLARPLHV